jgi:threonine synthase
MKVDGVDAKAAALKKSRYMFPWANPESVAFGILDDETYDWVSLVDGMDQTGGKALVIEDDIIEVAKDMAEREYSVVPCHTGAVGLAGQLTTSHRAP